MTAPIDDKRLTAKRERFCREYLIDLNATAAAKRAGYTERSAHVTGCRLLKNDKVAARIAALQAEAADRNEVTHDEVLAMLRQAYREAQRANQFGPSVRAAELLGKQRGMFRERIEITEIQAMPDVELVNRIAGDDQLLRQRLRTILGTGEGFEDAEGFDGDSAIH